MAINTEAEDDNPPVTKKELTEILASISNEFTKALGSLDASYTQKLNNMMMEVQNLFKQNASPQLSTNEKQSEWVPLVKDIAEYLKTREQPEDEFVDMKEQIKNYAKESLEIGHLINKSIKQKLVGNTMGAILDSHEPLRS